MKISNLLEDSNYKLTQFKSKYIEELEIAIEKDREVAIKYIEESGSE